MFRSQSDTEVILEAYKAWGVFCLDRFNGMFAFALLDTVERRLFCARDRYGEKPFLFASMRGQFAFASEYKALLGHAGVSAAFDEMRMLRGLQNSSCGLDTDRQTVFAAVQQLLPAEAMTVDLDTLQQRTWRYWDVRPRAEYASLSEAACDRAVSGPVDRCGPHSPAQ